MLAEIHHANGAIYGQGLDDHWMRRPGSLDIFHPSEALARFSYALAHLFNESE